jgi:hypothetical protein
MHLKGLFATLCLFSTCACDGPHEEAGEKADVAAGAVGSTHSLRQGPAERAGEKQDEAERKLAKP